MLFPQEGMFLVYGYMTYVSDNKHNIIIIIYTLTLDIPEFKGLICIYISTNQANYLIII